MSIFPDAHNTVLNNPIFQVNQVSESSKGAGLRELRGASIVGASHDSSERYPPPICHPGTRKEYIERLTHPPQNPDDHVDRITWLKGPAGVGKSAIAQSCADVLHSKKKLGASFFFSRPNHRDNPDCFFTTLAYQFVVKYSAYSAHLDKEIGRDPTIVTKSLPHQFHLLFVVPFSEPAILGEIGERVIIVDGLDECARPEAQVDIIQIVAESVQANTTPFIWIFLSRLEPVIVTTFNLPDIKSIPQHIDLPVSREIDQEILRYLADKLKDIGGRHGLALPWPSEEDVWVLVDFCDGLFACAHAIIYFVGVESPAGPVHLLNAVLKLAKRSVTTSGQRSLSALDELYTLIMERVPPAMLQTVQWILITTRVPGTHYAFESANLLRLSELQLRNTCRCLHSVLSLGTGDKAVITFYHASFMDFLEDPTRSGRFYLWSDCTITLLEEILRHLEQAQIVVDAEAPHGYTSRPDFTWSTEIEDQGDLYARHKRAFFRILGYVRLGSDVQSPHALTKFDFRWLSFVSTSYLLRVPDAELFKQNLDSQLKLLRPYTFRNWWASFWSKSDERYYTIGHAEKRALLMIDSDQQAWIRPYSPRRFKVWAKQQSELPKTMSRS